MAIKIYHEAPLCIFDKVRAVTDGDYALVHLLDKNDGYADYFLSRPTGRHLILDNSVFELGYPYDQDLYKGWISDLEADTYILPEVIGDTQQTLDLVADWFKHSKKDLPGKTMGVVQGSSHMDVVNCFKQLKALGADIIGIPIMIGNSTAGRKCSVHELMAERVQIISMIQERCDQHPIHLLGVAVPQEGKYHANQDSWVESIDTSNPVIHGMHDERYGHNGLERKISTLLADLIDSPVTPKQEEAIFYNIDAFKRLWNYGER